MDIYKFGQKYEKFAAKKEMYELTNYLGAYKTYNLTETLETKGFIGSK